MFGGPNCKTCRLVRVYLLVAIPFILMMWVKPDFNIPPNIDGHAVVGYFFGGGAALMIAWRYYFDIYRKKNK